MWYVAAAIEHAFGISLWITTLAYLVLIVQRNSIRTLYKNSPPLLLVFVSIFISAMVYLCALPLWMLISSQLLSSLNRQTRLVLVVSLFSQFVRFYYDIATLTLFIRRILILLFPLKPMRTVTKYQIYIVIAINFLLLIAVALMYGPIVLNDTTPIPPGCFSPSCMAQLRDSRTEFTVYLRLALTAIILAVGTVFLVVLRKKHFMQKTTFDAKVNQIARYVFYLRVVLELLPVVVDMVLANTVQIALASYVGPYGILGYTIECSIGTLFYCRIMSKKALLPQTVNTRSVRS
ncbi:hypothetical protein QR680_016339 [Steinernema hermaphroditum]|uniref:Uncharacterized protein n=1 Tax=Steinernema hermaphroditum TaxID=289476 RepID=A0AA39HBW9_9BILA|nr:hypothetical protein QR680_016339 [Steinernema hermaphroditum]